MKRIQRVLIGGLLVATFATSSFAALSAQYADWANGPVKFIMTKDEQASWKKVSTDVEAAAFIDLFWARRDPTPGTAQNEFHDAFDQRVKYADDNFMRGRVKGSLTDRGRVLIVLGAPTTISRTSPQPQSSTLKPSGAIGITPSGNSTSPGDRDDSVQAQGFTPRQVWTYEQTKTPTPLGIPKADVPFLDQYSSEDWRLDRTPSTDVNAVIAHVNQVAVLHPELTVAPKYAATPAAAPVVAPAPVPVPAAVAAPAPAPAVGAFKTEAFRSAVEAGRGKADGSGKLYLSHGEFVTGSGEDFEAVQIFAPKSAGLTADSNLIFFGEVDDAAGKPVAIVEEPAKLKASKDDFFYDKSLTLAPGKYTGTFGLAQDGKPIAVVSKPLDVSGLTKDAVGISDLILTKDLYALPVAQRPTDSFAFGGLKVVPKSDLTFTRKDDLSYFFELRNPGLDPESKAPKVRGKVSVTGKTAAGKPVSMNGASTEFETHPLNGVPGHFMVGAAIPLETFQPGDYTMKIKVTDAVTSVSYDIEQNFKVAGEK